MKKIEEYKAKKILNKYGIKMPGSGLLTETGLMENIIDFPLNFVLQDITSLIIKPQTLTGGRGKAGFIHSAYTIEHALKLAEKMIGQKISTTQTDFPETIKKVLIEEKISFEKELYISFVIDRATGKPIISISPEGGVDIEEISKSNPKKIKKLEINPLLKLGDYLEDYRIKSLADFCGLEKSETIKLGNLIKKLYDIFELNQLILLEINPMVLTYEKEFIALDAKITVDESALTGLEIADIVGLPRETKQIYVPLPVSDYGNISMIAHGAGMLMATIDLLHYENLKLSGFIDIDVAASTTAEEFAELIRVVMVDSQADYFFANIYTGVIAKEIIINSLSLLNENKEIEMPMVFRLQGCDKKTIEKINKMQPNMLYASDDYETAFNKLVSLTKQQGAR